LLARDDARPVEQQQQHRQQKADAESQDELHHQPQIIANGWQRLHLDAAAAALKAQHPAKAVGITT
jgi:hypothetical protein